MMIMMFLMEKMMDMVTSRLEVGYHGYPLIVAVAV